MQTRESLAGRNKRLRQFVKSIRGMPYGLTNPQISDLLGANDKDRGKRWMGKYNISDSELDIIEQYLNDHVGACLTNWDIDRVIKNLAKGFAANRIIQTEMQMQTNYNQYIDPGRDSMCFAIPGKVFRNPIPKYASTEGKRHHSGVSKGRRERPLLEVPFVSAI